MGKLWAGKIHGETNKIRVTMRVQIHLSAAFPSPRTRGKSGKWSSGKEGIFLMYSFTKGSLCLDFRQKTGEQRIPPVSAVS